MTEYAEIIITRHELFRGRSYETFEWIGKPTWPVQIGMFGEDEIIEKVPWPLKKVSEDYGWLGYATYVRRDGMLAIWAFYIALKYRLRRMFEVVYYRLILTAMVWGLAYVPECEVPSWCHLGKKRK